MKIWKLILSVAGFAAFYGLESQKKGSSLPSKPHTVNPLFQRPVGVFESSDFSKIAKKTPVVSTESKELEHSEDVSGEKTRLSKTDGLPNKDWNAEAITEFMSALGSSDLLSYAGEVFETGTSRSGLTWRHLRDSA